MTKVIWQGTVDNMELSGRPGGDKQPMRIVEDADGGLMTEYAHGYEQSDSDAVAYDESRWNADYQVRFRDPEPPFSAELSQRLLAANLIDA